MGYYYNVAEDVEAHPDAWCIVTVGGRNTGKTYGALKDCYEKNRRFVFGKRTMDDVDLLCSGSGSVGNKKNKFGLDVSPYKSINRDMGINVKAFSISRGLGGFWECEPDEKGEMSPGPSPLGYLIALAAVAKYAGFDMSDAEWLIMDEFMPRAWERVNRKEGDQLMDLYKTISRDREHRGLDPLKLLLLANAVNISTPITNTINIVDDMAEMIARHEDTRYIEDRGIFIRILKPNEEFEKKEKSTKLYKAMGNTQWGRMAFDNEFAYNDFSNVKKGQLKGFKPVCSICYKNKFYYIWMKDGLYYMNTSRHNSADVYDLSLENDQKRFYLNHAIDLRNECINGNMKFESYTMYDLIVNYHQFFKLR